MATNKAIGILRWLAILGSAIWAGIHMTLIGISLPYSKSILRLCNSDFYSIGNDIC